MGPSLASLCPDRCRGVSADPGADLTALTAKLRAAPLRGSWYDARGRRHSGTVRPIAIADLLYDADYNPALRAGVPMAVRAALDNGDAAPLLRLLADSRELAVPFGPARLLRRPLRRGVRGDAAAMAARHAAGDRLGVARDRALALPASAFAPFDAEVAYADEIDLCLRWPDPGQPPRAVGGAYPAVPALILQGQEDLRTPPEVSAHVAALIPGRSASPSPASGTRSSAPTRAAAAGDGCCASSRASRGLPLPARVDRRARRPACRPSRSRRSRPLPGWRAASGGR